MPSDIDYCIKSGGFSIFCYLFVTYAIEIYCLKYCILQYINVLYVYNKLHFNFCIGK